MTRTNGTADIIVATNGAASQINMGRIRPADIVGEMQVAYLDYAMSVIVARALPDVRDGLKPVHRRILYAMYADLGLTHDKPHRKSARVVGEVLGKYHPHGDVAVYDAMARMAQDFSLRYPLVDGQGNFGSVDGDSPAAMRYTEARLAEISDLILDDITKDTVAWKENFDNSLKEPTVLPAALPNLLINGSSGIAVGMATNIPPHNLGEVVDALAFLIDHYATVDEITVEQLMRFVQGPDFPTGGIVYRYREEAKTDEQVDAIAQGYAVGKSKLVIQAKAHFEEMSRGRSRILITELPYQTNKAALIERIAELVRDGKIEGISDLRDESDRTGMRVVIELTRTADPKSILADLFKYTPLQQTFGMQMLALVDGQPRLLSLKRMLHLFVQHREEIVRRRSEFELARARERAHILEGLLKALDLLDEVIDTIRRSQRVETARTNLMEKFGFSEIQAQAILDMQLRRLAALERKKLQDEYKEVKERISYLEELLAHPEKILALIKAELLAIKEKYGDARRTQIVERSRATLTTADLVPDQQVWLSVSSNGELRRQELGKPTATTFRQVGRGSEAALLVVNTRDTLFLFSADGRCARVAVHELPADGSSKSVVELGKFARGDKLVAALALPRTATESEENKDYLFLATVQGVVKRVAQRDLIGPNTSNVIAVDAKDRLGWVFATQGDQEVILVAASGQAIRFGEGEVRSMGLAAGGVGGIKLKSGDALVYAGLIDPAGQLITITQQGYGKRSALAEYPVQGRNGGGIVTHKLTDRTGKVGAALIVGETDNNETLVLLTRKGVVKLVTVADIPAMGRGVQGKPVVEASPNDAPTALRQVVTTAPPTRSSNGTTEQTPPPAPPLAAGVDKDGEKSKAAGSVKGSPAATAGVKPQRSVVEPIPAKATAAANPTNGARERSSAPPAKAEPEANGKRGATLPQAPATSQLTPARAKESDNAAVKKATTPAPSNKGQIASAKPVDLKLKQVTADKGRSPAEVARKNGETTAAKPDAAPAQPTLFAMEAAKPDSDRTQRAKKVQTVVSVPAAQAGKSKSRK